MKHSVLHLLLFLLPLAAAAQDIRITEIMPANVDMFVDPTYNYGAWVELYNPTSEEADLTGWWVSDDAADLRRARIPAQRARIAAGGRLVLWFDHTDTRKDVGEHWVNTNLPLKLDPEGGTLYLSDAAGGLRLQQSYPAAIMRCAWAERDGQWAWKATPTPGQPNTQGRPAESQQQLPPPEVSEPGQLFTGRLTVEVTVPVGQRLAYTTDGSTPTLASEHIVTNTSTVKPFVRRFNLTATTVFRFRLFSRTNADLPSRVVTRSYIYKDRDYYLPIVSLATDSVNLYSDTLGIYVTGVNGKTANQDGTRRNYNMEWERPASFEYIDANRDGGYFCQEVDIAINGGWSRKYEPRSFKIKAAKVYDLKNSLDYPFFADKPYHKHKALLLRNGGNDEYNQTRLKDAALQEVARSSGLGLNLQSYQPCHVFVDGQYLGLLNLREPSNKHYATSNYGADTDHLDAFEMSVDSGYVQKDGTRAAFEEWYSLAQNAADPLAYEQIKALVDIDDYTRYMAFKFFLNDWDWPHNNVKAFRPEGGRFHFVTFDLDNCVDRTGNNIFQDFASKQTHTFYTRPEYGWTSLTREVEMVTIFLNMLGNDAFRRHFIDTYCLVGGTTFGDEARIERVVNSIAARIETALQWEHHTPWGTGRSFAGGIISATTGSFRETMIRAMRSYTAFGLTGTEPVALRLTASTPQARLTLAGLDIPQSAFDGYVFPPVTLHATAPAGYRFAGWQTADGATTTTDVFRSGASWRYYDGGSLDGQAWTAPAYSATSWTTARAPFGYGSAGKTMAGATTQLQRNVPTVYFRRTFNLAREPQPTDVYTLHYSVDDGMIAYVNGTEAGLYHLWSGATYEETCQSRGQSWYEGDEPHTGTLVIPNRLLHAGQNTLAVELHNCNATSSDLWFDASLTLTTPADDEGTILSTDPDLEVSAAASLTARFTPDDACALPPVRINEVSAANSLYTDDYYKKDDWLELYNTTAEDVDLTGCTLVLNGRTTWTLPADTLPAHGYRIVWCSKREPLGRELHAPFKLPTADSTFVTLQAADGLWADTLVYDAHDGLQSVGRYPDGADSLYLMTAPTIAQANRLTSYDAPLLSGIPTAIRQPLATRLPDDTLYIYTPSGQLVATGSDRPRLPRGVYIARTKKGSVKFTVK